MKIEGLYKVSKAEEPKVTELYMRAFAQYPKMMHIFPDMETRGPALEATFQYYVPYDGAYGAIFSLDEEINEAVCIVHSSEMGYTEERHVAAGSYGPKYSAAMAKLTPQQRQLRIDLFDRLDELEKGLNLPEPHLYVDFLGVEPKMQNQGRGKKLMDAVSRYAEEQNLPLMLFTNTQADINFYKSCGFKVVGTTESEEFGFVNTYLVKEVS